MRDSGGAGSERSRRVGAARAATRLAAALHATDDETPRFWGFPREPSAATMAPTEGRMDRETRRGPARRQQTPGVLTVTFGDLIEAVTSIAEHSAEAALVVGHILRARALPRARRHGARPWTVRGGANARRRR